MFAHLRTLRLAAWLGWQLETNWTSPLLFAVYMFVKPVCGSLMLVGMFFAADQAAVGVGRARISPQFLPYMYVSNACYGLVGTVMFGLSYAVVRDREHYRMLKYVYISPAQFQTYFLGRGASRALEGIVGGVLSLTTGLILFAQVRDSVAVDVPWLLVYLAIGAMMLWACGMLLAAACLNMSRNGMFLSEGIAGLVYLLSGVVFPLSVFQGSMAWVQWVSLSLPTTYWLEGMRRALMGEVPEKLRGPLSSWSNAELALTLFATTAALVVAAQLFWRWSERRAWRLGKLEENAGV
ncbi:abc transporter : Transport permease protein OS=Candidatus Acetothermus autotrophicum GN=HGMM_OP2C039 PE=3 SV=1: ABC2_membrane [Gemmata massiliana]|uniref:ABC-2 type transporter transmembrane domain-containing protein n=1 Tax=Gemmata massiliana TaxID=1210884 RepID=A0A6P2CUK9_9BACT|nr:ABC transporter permease [Gemmata massiliana]VTR92056.1 abc transporter : Transport permease protein OS=Candidatus Acetothermus autotrophicum GN=HGMM_OP2C039 PE=3 SV=1: ABC2_membrane [Gemmata massiliana]